jgi:hypothetical protein
LFQLAAFLLLDVDDKKEISYDDFIDFLLIMFPKLSRSHCKKVYETINKVSLLSSPLFSACVLSCPVLPHPAALFALLRFD